MTKPKNGFFYKQVHGRRSTDKPGEKKFAIDWWKLILIPLLGWCAWVTIHGFMAENNKEEVEKLKAEKVAELEAYIDMQVGVMHGRITKVDDRLDGVIWQFFENELEDCQEECRDE